MYIRVFCHLPCPSSNLVYMSLESALLTIASKKLKAHAHITRIPCRANPNVSCVHCWPKHICYLCGPICVSWELLESKTWWAYYCMKVKENDSLICQWQLLCDFGCEYLQRFLWSSTVTGSSSMHTSLRILWFRLLDSIGNKHPHVGELLSYSGFVSAGVSVSPSLMPLMAFSHIIAMLNSFYVVKLYLY